jgi:osmotically-inducible protein OsmY
MKTSRFATIAALSLALGVSVVATGCGSTPTSASAGQEVDDSVITAKVKAKFVEDKAVSALAISVETYKGVVQLSGFANNVTEQERAGEIARTVTGVKSVKNDVRLKSAS